MEMQYMQFVSEDGRERPKRTFYTCSFRYLTSYERKWDIVLSKAKQVSGKGREHIEAVLFKESKIHFMPKNIGDIFPLLSVVEITDCDLREISRKDLKQFLFSFLDELYLSNNKIESLSADLFCDTEPLKILVLCNNKIKYIDQQTLTPLRYSEHLDFRGNTNIDEIYSSSGLSPDGVTWSVLNAKIALHCKPAEERMVVSSYIHNLWRGDFSDFEITAAEDVFKVHKNILAVNSPVFAAMFSHKMEENIKNEMKIVDFHSQTVKEFLEFVYLRHVPQKCFNASDLYAMSEAYQIKELSDIIQWLVVLEVSAENASEMFQLGVLHNNKNIKEAVHQQIEKFFQKKLKVKVMDSVEDMTDIFKAMETVNRFSEEKLVL